ncbi:MAG: hypothetical protein ABSF89_14470 [Acidimicrobiales bacterium]
MHWPPLGGKQFPHSLTALDLVTPKFTPLLRRTTPGGRFGTPSAAGERLAGTT